MSNKIIAFPKARKLKSEAKLGEYVELAKERFSELSTILKGDWSDDNWHYLPHGGSFILFVNSDEERNATELIEALKVYVVTYLWDRRLKGHLPTHSGLRYTTIGFRNLISRTKATTLNDINNDTYESFASEIRTLSIRTWINYLNSCNYLLRWLSNEYLLASHIELQKAPSINKLPAIKTKMPSRDLVQTILEAKWAVQEAEDNSHRWESDLLAVLTQAFQYGMGLRIGEVLRLPFEPLASFDNQTFFKVWTEKGKAPIARYIPTQWVEVFEETIGIIQRVSQPYRYRAIELETRGRLLVVEQRLEDYHKARMADVDALYAELDIFLSKKRKEAEEKWVLRDVIDPSKSYTLTETRELMPEPVAPTSNTNAMILKAFTKWGLEFIATPISRTQNRYHIIGKDIEAWLEKQIEFRANHVTDSELLQIIHGRRLHREQSQDTEFVSRRKLRKGGSALAYTMKDPELFKGGVNPPSTFSLKDARELLRLHGEGGFDSSKYIDVKSFQTIFPDLFKSGLSGYTCSNADKLPKPLMLSEKQIPVYTKTGNGSDTLIRYSKTTGYILKQESIHEYILSEFKRINLNIEQELYSDAHSDKQATVESVTADPNEGISQIPADTNLVMIMGISGSGKSTLAKTLIPLGFEHVEADQYFMKDGEYHFDREKLSEAHKDCEQRTHALLAQGKRVVVSNTFMQRKERAPYLKLTQNVMVITTTGHYQNMHSVPEEVIDSQRANYEPFLDSEMNSARDGQNVPSVVISSASFRVQQKVSEYLMLRAASDSGGGKALIPEIMSYKAIHYAFKGHDRIAGLLERYDITDDKDLVKEFQTHKGRHWRTTSLFRSGASGEVVNLWMGRDPAQGNQYDHNTDTERAKKIREALLDDHHRFLGAVSKRVQEMVEASANDELVEDFLEQELQVVQHTINGMCTRSMFLKPCEFNMRCLSGRDGKGCKHYLLDLADQGQIAKLRAWSARQEREATRLTDSIELGIEAARPHLDAMLPALMNSKTILHAYDRMLDQKKGIATALLGDFQPFRSSGSEPDDCPFQCGE